MAVQGQKIIILGFHTFKDLNHQSIFLQYKFENVNKMKNKPDLALFQTPCLSNETKKDTKIL
jgi:hypothetical protein